VGGFTWNVNANLTYNRNEVRKLVGGQNEIISGLTILRVGQRSTPSSWCPTPA
jgi:hypothetical protein